MSLLRRWFDPIRSSWFYQKPSRQAVLPIEQGLSIHLRLDDVYSYLAVQELPQLEEILSDALKPLKVIISSDSAEPPNQMSALEWQNYCLNDAQILSKQHRFSFHDTPEQPTPEALAQAETMYIIRLIRTTQYKRSILTINRQPMPTTAIGDST